MMTDRTNDQVVITTAHGQTTTFGYDKAAKQPVMMSGGMEDMKMCDTCKADVAAYYATDKMPAEKCPEVHTVEHNLAHTAL